MDLATVHRQFNELKARELSHGREAVEPDVQRFIRALPADANALMVAARNFCMHHRFDVGVPLAERAAALGGNTPQLKFALAETYYQARRPGDGVTLLNELVSTFGDDANLLAELGLAYEAMGDTDGARDALDRAIALAPRSAAALHERTLIEKVRPGDAVIGKLEALAQNTFGLPGPELVRLWYGLGKALDDVGEHKRAFEAFALGAQSFRSVIKFDEASAVRSHEAAERLFSRPLAKTAWTPEQKCIFIVGMPRSGTTMTEQILLGGDGVSSVGETSAFVESVWFAMRQPLNSGEPATSAQIAALGKNYALRMNDYGLGGASIIVDKTPTNALFAPLAFASLGARIVHCRRDVLDTCWSLYTTWFGEGTAWSYDFEAIARVYARYERAVQRWADKTGDAVLDVQYETMVKEPEATSAALFAHCGLDWRPDVLDFHARPKTVVTPSMSQVRKPVNTSSVRRLAPYLPMLEPLIDALKRAGVRVDV